MVAAARSAATVTYLGLIASLAAAPAAAEYFFHCQHAVAVRIERAQRGRRFGDLVGRRRRRRRLVAHAGAAASAPGTTAAGGRPRKLIRGHLAVVVDVELFQNRRSVVDFRRRQGIAAVGVEGAEQRDTRRGGSPG